MSSGVLRKYAPDDVTCIFGVQALVGFQEGTFIEVERSVETSTVHIGSDGEATLSISPNQSGTIKMTLQQASPSNDYLMSLFNFIQNKNTAQGVVPCSVTDKNGTTKCKALQAIVQKPSKVTFADKPEAREWMFVVPYLDMQVGGESSV